MSPAIPKTRKQNQRQPVGKTKAELKTRAKIILKEIIDGATTSKALQSAGYSKQYVNQHKQSILSNPVIQQTFSEVLNQAGVTDDLLSLKIRQLIDAKETKFFQFKGEVCDEREVEALGIQANMVEFAAKLKGHLVDRSEALTLTAYGLTPQLQASIDALVRRVPDTIEANERAIPAQQDQESNSTAK